MVGSATSTRADAPVGDPKVEIWSLNDCWKFLPTAHLWFEMHEREWFTSGVRPPEHLEWLQKSTVPILMFETHEDIPASVAYPEDQIMADLKCRRYFTSSFAYMLALACHDLSAGDEVRIYGVDASTNSEYAHQRPCIEYWFGRLEAKGITVVVPDACPLLKGPRYGRPDPDAPKRVIQQQTIEKRIRQLMADKARTGAEFNALQGRIDEAQHLRALVADR